jgi:DNA-directed RNA polymerase specialized sigma24 family protein
MRSSVARNSFGSEDVVDLIPRLRQSARRYRSGSEDAANDLVVLTLKEAFLAAKERPAEADMYDWLETMMRKHLN